MYVILLAIIWPLSEIVIHNTHLSYLYAIEMHGKQMCLPVPMNNNQLNDQRVILCSQDRELLVLLLVYMRIPMQWEMKDLREISANVY